MTGPSAEPELALDLSPIVERHERRQKRIATALVLSVVVAVLAVFSFVSSPPSTSRSSQVGGSGAVASPPAERTDNETTRADDTSAEGSGTDSADSDDEPSEAFPPPSSDGAGADVTESSEGKACRSTDRPGDYGSYPTARCRMWKASEGLRTGSPLATGMARIECQLDLSEKNPVYVRRQTNTWWVWTRSDTGEWDWFPETAVSEGAADQPINGVAVCGADGSE